LPVEGIIIIMQNFFQIIVGVLKFV